MGLLTGEIETTTPRTTNRSKLVFATGFLFGLFLLVVVNYITFAEPRHYRGPSGVLSMHDPTFSGFPFAMYIHGNLFSSFLPDGVFGNLLFGLILSSALGWIATKIPGRKVRLK